MAHAYTPGLTVAASTEIRKRRILPLKGEVLVEAGDRVPADRVVARAFLPGAVTPINVAQKLGVQPEDVPSKMTVKEGGAVMADQTIAFAKSFFGLFTTAIRSPVEGSIESVSARTGQVMIRQQPHPIELEAYVAGEVAEVFDGDGVEIVTWGSVIQGIFGVGGERRGSVRVCAEKADAVLTAADIPDDAGGAIIVGGAFADAATFRRAEEVGAAALVVGGFSDSDLRGILGYDLGVAITGQESLKTTLILTEGFGRIPMNETTFELLRSLRGRMASVNGATQIRAGVLRPEILVPAADPAGDRSADAAAASGQMDVGSTVRIIREPHFGALGRVSKLPSEPGTIQTGARVRVLRVSLEGGEEITLPRANVELIES